MNVPALAKYLFEEIQPLDLHSEGNDEQDRHDGEQPAG
jgi:hypothetical protein